MNYYYNHHTQCDQPIQPLGDEVFRLVDPHWNVTKAPHKYEHRVAWAFNNLRNHPKVLFAHPNASYSRGTAFTSVTFTSLCDKEQFDKELLDLSFTKKSYLVVTKIQMYGSSINVSFTWKDSVKMDTLIRRYTIDLILHELR